MKEVYGFYYPPQHPNKVQIIKIRGGVFEIMAEKQLVEFEILDRLTGVPEPYEIAREENPGEYEEFLAGTINPHSSAVERWFKNWKKENGIKE